ncbi:MAG: hypothetical protein M3416_16405 [Acidobacteriota bacterium]|nr:hypothetical protein [Acidobacteriota bacterium]
MGFIGLLRETASALVRCGESFRSRPASRARHRHFTGGPPEPSTFIFRAPRGPPDVYNRGVADLKLTDAALAASNPVFYEYHLRSFSLDAAGGPTRVQVDDFSMSLRVPLQLSPEKVTYQDVGFRNPVALREGERVVVLSAATMK